MIAYVDSSIVLRKLFGEPGSIASWAQIEQAYASRLLVVETSRVIDRVRLMGQIDDEAVAQLHEERQKLLRSVDLVQLNDTIIERATLPMPTVVGTLDALHLSTALEVKKQLAPAIVFLTHDLQLARAARASGFVVQGVQ